MACQLAVIFNSDLPLCLCHSAFFFFLSFFSFFALLLDYGNMFSVFYSTLVAIQETNYFYYYYYYYYYYYNHMKVTVGSFRPESHLLDCNVPQGDTGACCF